MNIIILYEQYSGTLQLLVWDDFNILYIKNVNYVYNPS